MGASSSSDAIDISSPSPVKSPRTPRKVAAPVRLDESDADEDSVEATSDPAASSKPAHLEEDVKEEKKKKQVKKEEKKKQVKEKDEDEEDDEEEPAKPAKQAASFFSPKSSAKSGDKKPKKSDAKPKEKADDSGKESSAEAASEIAGFVPYALLASLFAKIEAITARLEIQELLTLFFRDVIRNAPKDLLACIYLCVCTDLAPPFENLKIGIGDAILMKAIGEATGTNLKFIKEMYHKEGDLGKVAQNARSKQHTLSFAPVAAPSAAAAAANVLSVQSVFDQFVKIAKMTGNNSQQQKCSIIKGLLVKCEKDKKVLSSANASAEGAKYIIRGLQGKLRIGLAEKSILMALTYAFMREKDRKDKDKQQQALAHVKKAFSECPSYNALVAALQSVQDDLREADEASWPFLKLEDFAKVADKCVLTPGTPVSPMLARPTKAYAMVFDRFEGKPFTCEYKYDGERAQIHMLPSGKGGNDVSIFSRNFENSTERFPDVKMQLLRARKPDVIQSCIVDAEVVAVDRASNKRLPFQILSTRSRKNVKVEDIKVPVCIYAFDLLFLNGEPCLTMPLGKRRELLRSMFAEVPGEFEFASSIDVAPDAALANKDDAEALELAVSTVRNFLEQAVRDNCEGLMVKTLEQEATYEPANRSHKWLKLKKDYLDGIGDSTDLVPIGAFYGRGKRTGVYGAYLLACMDPDTDMFQPITKLGTGLSDEVLKQFHEHFKDKTVPSAPREYALGDGSIKPDVWFEPSCVWEILGADLSISPKYTAAMGLVARDKGISLRFPRFIRVRDDKPPSQATSAAQVRPSLAVSSGLGLLVVLTRLVPADRRLVPRAGPRDRLGWRRGRRRRPAHLDGGGAQASWILNTRSCRSLPTVCAWRGGRTRRSRRGTGARPARHWRWPWRWRRSGGRRARARRRGARPRGSRRAARRRGGRPSGPGRRARGTSGSGAAGAWPASTTRGTRRRAGSTPGSDRARRAPRRSCAAGSRPCPRPWSRRRRRASAAGPGSTRARAAAAPAAPPGRGSCARPVPTAERLASAPPASAPAAA